MDSSKSLNPNLSLFSLSLPVTLCLGQCVSSWPTLISPFVTEDEQHSGAPNRREKVMPFCLQGTLPFSQTTNQKLLMRHKIRLMNLGATLKKDVFSKVFINSSLNEHLLIGLVLAVMIEKIASTPNLRPAVSCFRLLLEHSKNS